MGMPTVDAVDLVLRMADRCRLPYALRRADTFARAARSHRGRPPARLTYVDAWNTAGEDVSAETHCAIAWDVSAADALAREVFRGKRRTRPPKMHWPSLCPICGMAGRLRGDGL